MSQLSKLRASPVGHQTYDKEHGTTTYAKVEVLEPGGDGGIPWSDWSMTMLLLHVKGSLTVLGPNQEPGVPVNVLPNSGSGVRRI